MAEPHAPIFSEDIEALKPSVLRVLKGAERPLKARQIAAAVGGNPALWAVKAAVRSLRDDGHPILSLTYRGYWLYREGGLPSGFMGTRDPWRHIEPPPLRRAPRLENIRYPVDAVVVRSVLEARGIDPKDAFYPTKGEQFRKRCLEGRLYSAERYHYPWYLGWHVIWRAANVMGVPPEMLIDENRYLFGGFQSAVPAKFAGYKLLFAVKRLGWHPMDVIPPAWEEFNDLDDLKANPDKHIRTYNRMHRIYIGNFRAWLWPEDILYICSRVAVSPAELFVGWRKKTDSQVLDLGADLLMLPVWDRLFLTSVAKLLCRSGDVEDSTLASALALLVQERAGWRAELEQLTTEGQKSSVSGAS